MWSRLFDSTRIPLKIDGASVNMKVSGAERIPGAGRHSGPVVQWKKARGLSPEMFNDGGVMSVRVPEKGGGTRAPNTGHSSFLWVQVDTWDVKVLRGQSPVNSSDIFPTTREDGSRYGQLWRKGCRQNQCHLNK